MKEVKETKYEHYWSNGVTCTMAIEPSWQTACRLLINDYMVLPAWDQWRLMILCLRGATSFSMTKMERCFLMESKWGDWRIQVIGWWVVGCWVGSERNELIFKLECCTESDNWNLARWEYAGLKYWIWIYSYIVVLHFCWQLMHQSTEIHFSTHCLTQVWFWCMNVLGLTPIETKWQKWLHRQTSARLSLPNKITVLTSTSLVPRPTVHISEIALYWSRPACKIKKGCGHTWQHFSS